MSSYRYRFVGMLIVATVVSFALGHSALAAEPVSQQAYNRAKMVDNYVSNVLRPLFECFTSAYNGAKAASSSKAAHDVYKNLRKCRMITSMVMDPPPDGDAASIKSEITSLMDRLEPLISELESKLSEYENVKTSGQRYAYPFGKEDTYRRIGYQEGDNYRRDRYNMAENAVGRVRVKINDLGADYKEIEKHFKEWIERVKAEIKRMQSPGGK